MPRLVLLRHGEAAWNPTKRLAGWWDVPLTARGVDAATSAGRRLAEDGLEFDLCLTSLQTRAIQTLNLVLDAMGRLRLPVEKDWRLNERHYGALTGLDRMEAVAVHGEGDARRWLREPDGRPPPLGAKSPYDLANDARYAGLIVPRSESLTDTMARVLSFWRDSIEPNLMKGRRVLVCGHGNSIGALVKHLSNVADDAIGSIEVPVAEPITFDLAEWYGGDGATSALAH